MKNKKMFDGEERITVCLVLLLCGGALFAPSFLNSPELPKLIFVERVIGVFFFIAAGIVYVFPRVNFKKKGKQNPKTPPVS